MKRILFYLFFFPVLFSSCLSDMPDSISSDIELNTSLAFPLGETSLGLNEISGFDESLLYINPLTGKPFWVEFEEVPLSYTMPFEIGDIYQSTEEIVQLVFRINMYNGFPANVKVQLYFLDAGEFPLDSLFTDGPVDLKKATATSSGKITSKPYSKKDIVFNSDRLDKLQFADKAKVYVVFSTSGIDENLVEFYSNYFVDVQIGVMAQLKINL